MGRGAHLVTHGLSHRPEYHVWASMRARCNNPKCERYPHYGARGIRVCPEWDAADGGFAAFFEHMGPRPSPLHTLERDALDGHYQPGNCRWATRAEQALNRSDNVRLTALGKTQTMKEWSIETGLALHVIWARIRVLGWNDHDAVTRPKRKIRGRR